MIATSTALTPGRRDTAVLILVAQDAQSMPETVHSQIVPPLAVVFRDITIALILPPPTGTASYVGLKA
jgi:hypothetical protein